MTKVEVQNELSKWKIEFMEIFNLFDHPISDLSEKQNLKVISERYSMLKEKVIAYNKQLQNDESKGKLSKTALAFLVPAIREVALHCSAKQGSMNKQELVSSLYDGQDYLFYYLGQLNA